MKTSQFGNKCECGHFESEHAPQDKKSANSVIRYQMEPRGYLPMGMAPTISYDPRRGKCKICDCKLFKSKKRWGLF